VWVSAKEMATVWVSAKEMGSASGTGTVSAKEMGSASGTGTVSAKEMGSVSGTALRAEASAVLQAAAGPFRSAGVRPATVTAPRAPLPGFVPLPGPWPGQDLLPLGWSTR
jgi:hypothetical protein